LAGTGGWPPTGGRGTTTSTGRRAGPHSAGGRARDLRRRAAAEAAPHGSAWSSSPTTRPRPEPEATRLVGSPSGHAVHEEDARSAGRGPQGSTQRASTQRPGLLPQPRGSKGRSVFSSPTMGLSSRRFGRTSMCRISARWASIWFGPPEPSFDPEHRAPSRRARASPASRLWRPAAEDLNPMPSG
jgi:hypothetical protein